MPASVPGGYGESALHAVGADARIGPPPGGSRKVPGSMTSIDPYGPAFGARPSKKSTFFAKPLDVDPQSCYYDNTSFAGLFFMPFFKGACKREGGLLTDNGGAEQ